MRLLIAPLMLALLAGCVSNHKPQARTPCPNEALAKSCALRAERGPCLMRTGCTWSYEVLVDIDEPVVTRGGRCLHVFKN